MQAEVSVRVTARGSILKESGFSLTTLSVGFFVFAALSGSAQAQGTSTPSDNLPVVVVTANRAPTSASDTLADVTVITRAMIEQSSARSVAQLLQQLGGLEIAETGGAAKTSGIFIRGSKTAQTLVLVDGVRLENAGSGGANIEFLALENIERIEVVRGAGSANFGSAAIGGVVQIFTRKQTGPRLQVELGSFQSSKVSFGLGGQLKLAAGSSNAVSSASAASNALRYSVQVHSAKTDGYDSTLASSPYAQPDRDGSKQKGINLVLDATVGGFRLGLSSAINEGKSFYDDAFSTPATAFVDFKNSAWSLSASRDLNDRWTSGLRYGQSSIGYSYGAFEYAPRAKTESIQWENQVQFAPRQSSNPHSLNFGWERNRQTVRGLGVAYLPDERTTSAVWLGAQVKFNAHKARLQWRNDRVQSPTFSTLSDNNYSLGYGYEINNEWQISMTSASAFRAPTFDDLFSPSGGNAALRPERSKVTELSLQHRSNALELGITGFTQRIRNAIELDQTFTPQNSQQAKIDGLSVNWKQRFGSWAANGQLTIQNPRFIGDGAVAYQQLARRAKQFGSFGLANQFGAVSANLALLFQGQRIDSDGSVMKAYALVNAGADFAATQELTVGLRLVNMLNKNYETTAGYRGEPRGAYLNLAWKPTF